MSPAAQHALAIDIVVLMFIPPLIGLVMGAGMAADWWQARKERQRIAAILSRNDRAEAHREAKHD